MVFSCLFIGMEKLMFNICNPEYSYFIGFIQADGHLQKNTRNRGKLTIEISVRDIDILNKFQKIIPVNSTMYTRVRQTNFSNSHTGVTLNVFDKEFRDTINYYGVPYGKKSDIIKPPDCDYSEHDYWRGIIDADGSIGMTSKGLPFISLVTASGDLYNVFNITIGRENSQKIIQSLYYSNCIALDRKIALAQNVLKWKRPDNLPIKTKMPKWSQEEIELLYNNDVKTLKKLLPYRTETAIKVKKYRILK
jgi:hypothetical protein